MTNFALSFLFQFSESYVLNTTEEWGRMKNILGLNILEKLSFVYA